MKDKLAKMLQRNPQRMDYYKRYQEIVADYNREKDRTTIEEAFARLVELVQGLDAEQQRAAEEGLNEEELAIFDLLRDSNLTKTDRERVKQASQQLFASLKALLAPLDRWWEKTQTQAEVQTFILDNLFLNLPNPPFNDGQKQEAANRVYQHIWRQSASGHLSLGAG